MRCLVRIVIMSSEDIRVYVLIELQPGKEREFAEEILSKGLILDSKVERLDFVHGSYDFIIAFNGKMKDVDRRIMEMRKSPYIRKTESQICFEVITWDELEEKVHEEEMMNI